MSFVEIRTYELKPGTAGAYVGLYWKKVSKFKSHLGEPVGYYVVRSETSIR